MALPQRNEEREQAHAHRPANENRAPALQRQQPRLIIDNTGTKVPASDTPSRVVPGSARVERKREAAGELEPGTRPDIAKTFQKEQYGDRFTQPRERERGRKERERSAPQVERKRRSGRRLTARKLRKGRKKLRKLKAKGVPATGLARTLRRARVTRATLIAAGLCLPFFTYQVFWTIVFFTGMAIEGNAIGLARLFDDNVFTRLIDQLVRLLFPGAALAAVAWVIIAVLGLIQMAITFIIYVAHMINPIGSSRSLLWFGGMLVFQFLPIAIIPWVVPWMWVVVKDVYGNE